MKSLSLKILTLISCSLFALNAQAELRIYDSNITKASLSDTTLYDRYDFGRLLVDPDYTKECNPRRDEKRSIYYGDLTLSTAADIEKFRCLKRVTGNLRFEIDNEMIVLVMPWLEQVNGYLWLEAGGYFEKGKFPKLSQVDGDIILYNRTRSAHWWMPALTQHNAELEVVAGVLNDLTGFVSLSYLKRLYLRNHPNDIYGPFKFEGLGELTAVSSIEYNLREGQVDGSFLSKLIQVNNKVEIYIHDGQLFGLSNIQTIAGYFIMKDTNYTYHLNNLSSLTSLGGLKLEDNASLNNVDELLDVNLSSGGYIKIVNNDSLGNCEAKQLVRALRNDPNWNQFSGSNTYVYGNGYPDC